jgi:O-acetyl-ADP-ribose deacetylase (regulator of RNase III)
MIKYTKGNLLESEAQALVNTVNTIGVMGKGIALMFKEQFPNNFSLYHKACKQKKVKIGEMFTTVEDTLNGKKIIINFPTKTTWRKPSEYSYIESGLVALRKEILNRNLSSIAIPPLGSHNGGLDWNRVRGMIEAHLSDLPTDITIYEPSDAVIERLNKERVGLTPARAMMLDVLCDMIAYGEFISVFAAEKVVYFLQRFGAKNIFNVEFIKYYYGPYSKGKIGHTLYHLNGYITGMGGMQVRPFDELWMLPDTPKTVQAYLSKSENSEYKKICENTKHFLRGYYSTFSLELLATIDFILQEDCRLKHWQTMAQEQLLQVLQTDLQQWSSRKDKLFGHIDFMPIILQHLLMIHPLPTADNERKD